MRTWPFSISGFRLGVCDRPTNEMVRRARMQVAIVLQLRESAVPPLSRRTYEFWKFIISSIIPSLSIGGGAV